ncbi:surface antigen-domain-containing protein [Pilobolus umbonatus]|nr:surface antigen-domain-containing protein [Pilobolus umbonatus]
MTETKLAEAAGTSAHVNAVTVLNTKATRPSFLHTATKSILEAKTVADVINLSQQTAERLQQLDIFESVQLRLDNASDMDPLAAPGSINVVYRVKEKSRVFIKTGTEIGNNEGNMNGSITLRNVFGGAELLEAMASSGTRNSSAFQFTLSRPVNASPDSRIDINAHRVLCSNTVVSSYEELSRGIGLRYKTVSNLGYHELSYGVDWRSIDRVLPSASMSIRREAGNSLKSSIHHIFIHDRRDDALLPSNGHYVRVAQELSGVFGIGNSHFFKTEIETQLCKQLGGGQVIKGEDDEVIGVHPGFVFSGSFKTGVLANLCDSRKGSTVSDRFLLGGPLSVRGFRNGGIGPRDGHDALGGNMYWAAGLSAIAPIPKLESKPVRAHAFVNAGTNIPWKTGTNAAATMEALTQSPSVSTGFGIIFRHSIARIELNYCIPLTAARGDHVKRGLQLGLGLNFL